MITYKHSFANYPKKFLGTVVSPHKICLQFQDVRTTLRVAYRDESDLIKLPSTDPALPVVPSGVGIDILAVGCEMPVLEQLQSALIKAYKIYKEQHNDYYIKHYGKHFYEFIQETINKLKEV